MQNYNSELGWAIVGTLGVLLIWSLWRAWDTWPVAHSALITLNKSPTKENRKANRWSNANSVHVLISLPGHDCLYDGWVVDFSKGGLCIFANQGCGSWGLRRGLQLRVQSPRTTNPWVPVEVRYARRDIYGWLIGCQFLNTVPSEVLKGFRDRS